MNLPIACPSCESLLNVSRLKCNHCETEISGNYELPLFLKLSKKEQAFILDFFLSSGSIKAMTQKAEMSYPTMRNKMDDLIQKIEKLKS